MKRSVILFGAIWMAAASLQAASLYTDTNVYKPLQLSWSTPADVKKSERIFPHPLLPNLAVLITADSILQTEDGGKSWKPWADSAKLGKVRAVTFDPMDPNRFLAAGDHGIWVSADRGKTFQKFGGADNGLASDNVVDLIFYGGDPGGNTILAVHGTSATGISRTRNQGKSWDVINPEYCFFRILSGDSMDFKRLYLFGAGKDEPDVLGLFSSITPGEYMGEMMRDALLTDMAFEPTRRGTIIVSTSDAGAFRMGGGSSALGQEAIPMPVEGVEGWSSLAATWGPNADVVELCAYDPSKTGLVLSGDQFQNNLRFTTGIVISPLVKQGAAVRPNANGTIFYAVANGILSIGRDKGVPEVTATPAVLELGQGGANFTSVKDAFLNFAKTQDGNLGGAAEQLVADFGDLEEPYRKLLMTVTAVVPGKPKQVLIDLSRAGGSPQSPMFDDGKHSDGAANDGVYGLGLVFDNRRNDQDWRPTVPGRIPLGVSAVYDEGPRTGAVALAGVYSKIVSFNLWDKRDGNIKAGSTGEVAVRPTKNPPDVHGGSGCLRIETRPGKWSISLPAPYNHKEITGYEVMSFYIRADDKLDVPQKLEVQFVDDPELSEPTTTEPIVVVPDMIEQGAIGKDYRRVIVSLDSVASGGFQPSRLGKIIISGEAKAPGDIYLDGIEFNATRAELETP